MAAGKRGPLPAQQNSHIWLYRYHCLSLDKPEGVMIGGSWSAVATQLSSARSLKVLLSESLNSFTETTPGVVAEN